MAGILDSYEYPPFPLWQNYPSIDVSTVTAAGANDVATGVGITRDTTKGILVAVALDCEGTRLAGATITLGALRVVYAGEMDLDPTLTATTDAGFAVVFDVPPGPVTFDIRHGTTTFRAAPVDVYANSMTYSTRHP
jgi:hypothetical protein